MKRNLLLLFFILTFVNNLFGQNPLVKQWDYRFGGPGQDYLYSFQHTSDGGYIHGGFSYSGIGGDKTQPNWGGFDYWIVKSDSLGNKQWDKNFGGTLNDYLYCIRQCTDGGFIIGGYSSSDSSGDKTQHNWNPSLTTSDYWIIKIDSLGNKQWDKDFGGIEDERLFSIQQTSDKGYILGGYSHSGISGDKTQANWDSSGNSPDYWILKTDSLGNKQWDKTYGGTSQDNLYCIWQTADKGYIFGGNSDSDSSGDKTQNTWGISNDYWIVKTDSFGNKQWDKDFGGTDNDYLYSLQQTTDGGYILGGYSKSGIGGDKTQPSWGVYDFWIVKTDSLGIKQWDKDFGGTDNEDDLGNISQTADGGYLIGGTSYSPISGDKTEDNLGEEQTWVVKTDSLGNKQWDKTLHTDIGTSDDETGFAVETNDGCFTMANATGGGIGGDKTQPSQGQFDYWMIKFCDTTLTSSIAQFSNYSSPFSVYPNPTERILTIALNKSKKITVINLLGEIMVEKNISSVSSAKVDLDISFLSAGIYFIKVDNEVKKFVKE